MTGLPVLTEALLSVAAALLVVWVVLLVVLLVLRPGVGSLREGTRLLPDVLRLVRRLATDRSLPRGVRLRLGLLIGYLALPFDLVPDFVPVLGWADDLIVVVAVLRSVVRRAGIGAVRRHWPGTDEGFVVLRRLAGL